MRAMEGALRGKQRIDEGAARALKSMNIPTRSEFKKALTRIEALEHELLAVKAKLKKAPASTPRRAGAKKR
jgi:polyhydroxyalkanoate synthesis regulator phasin